MNQKKQSVLWKSIVFIIVDLLILILFLFGFTYVRYAVLLTFLIMAIVFLVRKKWLVFMINILLVVALYFIHVPGRFPVVFYGMEKIRFEVLQNQYQKVVDEISDSLDDTDVLTPVSIDHPFLSSAGKIHYQKSGDSIVILFTTEYEEVSGYVWCSDDAADSWIENFYRIEALSDSWSMVQIYS